METEMSVLKPLPKELTDISFRPEGYYDELEELKPPYRNEHRGAYDYNNGVIAYVDEKGDMFCIPVTRPEYPVVNDIVEAAIKKTYGDGIIKISEILEDAGYVKDAFWVPHSNDGGYWAHQIFEDSNVVNRTERKMMMEEFYKRLYVEPELNLPEEVARRFKPAWEIGDLEIKINNVGLFNSNHLTLAYVDKYAITHVAVLEDDLVDELKKAGFKEAPIYVPHSNDCGKWLNYMFPREFQRVLERIDREHEENEFESLRKEAGIIVEQ